MKRVHNYGECSQRDENPSVEPGNSFAVGACLPNKNKHSRINKICIILFLSAIGILGICEGTYAQSNYGKQKWVYAEIGEGTANGKFTSFNVAVNTIFGNDHNNIFTVGFYYFKREDPNCPADYSEDISSFLNPFATIIHPIQDMRTCGLMYGKVIYTGSPKVRLALKGGMLAGVEHHSSNFEYTGGNPNYTYTHETKLAAGLLLNPVLELPLSPHFGFALGGYANINPIVSIMGVDIRIIIGKLRDKSNNYGW